MKLTDRQQMKLWLEESRVADSSEEVLGKIFSVAMEYKKTHPNLTLRQLYSYAYMVYLDENVFNDRRQDNGFNDQRTISRMDK